MGLERFGKVLEFPDKDRVPVMRSGVPASATAETFQLSTLPLIQIPLPSAFLG